MTTKVTKESLADNIGRLESYGDPSINEEYQAQGVSFVDACPRKRTNCFMGVFQDGRGIAHYHTAKAANKDGADEIVPLYEDFTND